jgi:PAS domain S-box-containing protein
MENITTSRRPTRDRLAEAKQWQDTFDAMSEALSLMDLEGRITQCNRALCRLVDKPTSQIIGRKCWEILHGTENPLPSCPCPLVQKKRKRSTTTMDIGERRFNVAVDPQYDENGDHIGYIHIMSDITERQRAETALREAHQTLMTVLNSIDATIYVADMQTHEILFMNRLMQETYNGDFTGQLCWQAFRKKTGPCSDCTNDRLVDADDNPTNACVYEGHQPGTGRWYVNSDRAVKWIDGRLVRLQVATDITKIKGMEAERRHTETKLRQAQKMEAIGTLAGGIAHDFNNILSAILGYSELALEDALNDRAAEAYIRQILKAGHRARDLVNQILTFSRQTETETKPIQVKPIIKEALKLLRASLPATIDIRTDIQSDAIVEADPIQIHQVIMNLCTNAGHAMRHNGGALTVCLTEYTISDDMARDYKEMAPGDYLKLSVSDTGPGIAPTIIDRIFEPYFTSKQKGEGTGMGLAVVQGIVQSCKGAVSVYSPPGEGATFDVYLPIIRTRDSVQTKVDIIIPGGNENILFVDDEPALADLSKQILERMGYHVTIRTNSIEALRLFEQNPQRFDLVVTDMTMPHMTGDLLAIQLIRMRPDMRIIICTGYSDKLTQELVDRLNIRALILKPIIRDELLATVRQVLDDPQ